VISGILVAFASRHGATGEIAIRIATELREGGLTAEALNISATPDPARYDAVVLGSGIYMGRWLAPARRYVQAHGEVLCSRPVWLFSSGPVGANEQVRAETCADGEHTASRLNARDHRMFAGRLDRSELDWIERAAVHAVGAPEGDYRDWAAITGFARQIADALTSSELASAHCGGLES
jgi:menaquinone-dependent protoporphyrinogen oxidase